MSEDGEQGGTMELPQIWQFVHPHYNSNSDDEEGSGSEDEGSDAAAPTSRGGVADYVKLSRKAPRLGRLVRFLNDIEDEAELQQVVLERDPVTQQSLLQWASLSGHFMLVEYLVKRLRRGAFSFDPDWQDVVVFTRWEEMRAELPAAADVAERQKAREQERAQRQAQRAAAGDSEEDEGFDDEEEEAEPMPEEMVYDTLDEFHEQWGDRGVGIVKRIGELGVYHGARLRDGTKEGLGQSLFANGDCYTGEYHNNQREGKGVYWWAASGAMYSGDWARNMRQGSGRIAYPDGSRFLGHWRNDKKNGEGTYTYADGSRYTGTWVDNEKHGQGRYDFADGSSYVGSFYHNEFISGEWWLASGTVKYVGNFVGDRPDGAGVFVHRCGLKEGTFQQEGAYREGRWIPGTLKGTAKVMPRLEVVAAAPAGQAARVPIEFASDCAEAAHTMADLVRAANFGPLQAWLRRLPSAGVTAKRIEVLSMRYDDNGSSGAAAARNRRLVSVRIRPHLITADGTRYRRPISAEQSGGPTDEDGVVTLNEPSCRLLLLLHSADAEAGGAVAVVERVGESGSYRLPVVRVKADGAVGGAFSDRVGPALRLSISARTVCPLVEPTEAADPLESNPAESVVLYAQEVHPDAFAALEEKLAVVSSSSQTAAAATCVAVPLAELVKQSADAITASGATTALHRREAQTLPQSTVAPQRPPTPLPPAIEPRPELQPLYEAKAARDAAAEGDDTDA